MDKIHLNETRRHRTTGRDTGRILLIVFSFLALSMPLLTGCASILISMGTNAVDAIQCNNECPGGPFEKECIKKCKERLAAERARLEGNAEDAKWLPKTSHEYQPPKFTP